MKVDFFDEVKGEIAIRLQDRIILSKVNNVWIFLTREEASELQDALNDYFGVISTE